MSESYWQMCTKSLDVKFNSQSLHFMDTSVSKSQNMQSNDMICNERNTYAANYMYITQADRHSTHLVWVSSWGTPLQNWINLKRKSTFFPTEQWKNDNNWMRNKEDMTFWNFTFFRKTFLDQSLWIFKWASWWCHPLTIFHIYCIWNFENFSFLAHTGKNISPYQNVSE